METTTTLVDILREVGIPVLTLLGGWFGHMFRTKQKKEGDILDNVKQILEMQKTYIAEQDDENKKTRDINRRLEAKLDGKNRSIRKANWCKFTNEGEGCPVLNQEEKNDAANGSHEDKCEGCQYNKEEKEEA